MDAKNTVETAINLIPILSYLFQAGVNVIVPQRRCTDAYIDVDYRIFKELFPNVEPYGMTAFGKDYRAFYQCIDIRSHDLTTDEEYERFREEHPLNEEISY